MLRKIYSLYISQLLSGVRVEVFVIVVLIGLPK